MHCLGWCHIMTPFLRLACVFFEKNEKNIYTKNVDILESIWTFVQITRYGWITGCFFSPRLNLGMKGAYAGHQCPRHPSHHPSSSHTKREDRCVEPLYQPYLRRCLEVHSYLLKKCSPGCLFGIFGWII